MEVKLYVLKVIINQLASIYRTTFSKWFPGIGMDKIKNGKRKKKTCLEIVFPATNVLQELKPKTKIKLKISLKSTRQLRTLW